MENEAVAFRKLMSIRRSCRFFSPRPIPENVLENCIAAAGTSPSGAHTEPWTYVVVKTAEIKRKLREIIEEEEKENYARRMGINWVVDLAPLGTDWQKPYLELAPAIVILFEQTYGFEESGVRKTHHYHEISTAMSAGIFVAAVHNAGLVTVTTTPLNAGRKLRELCARPEQEKVLVLFPVGFPADTATMPVLKRKALEDIMVVI